jgi:outer membrane protein assembly factor BamB
VFAFDRATGGIRWTAPPVVITGQPGQDERFAAVGGDVVLVTSLSGAGGTAAYDAGTGSERWRRTDFSGSLFLPMLDSTTAYVDHGWVFASYDLLTGAIRWAAPPDLSGPVTDFKGTPIIASDRIYVAGNSGSYALRR